MYHLYCKECGYIFFLFVKRANHYLFHSTLINNLYGNVSHIIGIMC